MPLVHVSGWLQASELEGGQIDNTLPSRPARPVRPDNSLPDNPYYPDNSLPGWIQKPIGKPPGRPVLPDNTLPPPAAPPHPWLPGGWVPVDPGFGKPPLWGWMPGPDNGLPAPPVGPGQPPGGGGGGGGSWVPTDPDYGKPVHPCPPQAGTKPVPPVWIWIPVQPPDLAKPVPSPTPEPKLR